MWLVHDKSVVYDFYPESEILNIEFDHKNSQLSGLHLHTALVIFMFYYMCDIQVNVKAYGPLLFIIDGYFEIVWLDLLYHVYSDIMGMVTVGNMMAQVVRSKVKPSDPISKVMYKQFKMVCTICVWDYFLQYLFRFPKSFRISRLHDFLFGIHTYALHSVEDCQFKINCYGLFH